MDQDKPKKICFIVPSFAIGGVETHTLELVKNLDKRSFDPFFLFFVSGDGPFEGRVKKENIRYHVVHKKSKLAIFSIFSLLKVIQSEKPDIIHTQLFGGDFWGRIAGILYRWQISKKVKIVSTLQNVEMDHGMIKRLSYKFLSHFTDNLTAITEAVKKYMQEKQWVKKEIHVIPNIVDIQKFYYQPRDYPLDQTFNLVSVGRLTEQKGHIYLLEAIKRLTEKKLDVHLTLIGTGELRNSLEKKCEELKIEQFVTFVGNSDSVYEDLKKHNLFVLPSLWEGLGNVLIEASASGLPIVATNVGGIPEIVQQDKNALLVGPKDSEALANNIAKLMENQDRYEAFSRASIENIKRFDTKKTTEQYQNLYLAK